MKIDRDSGPNPNFFIALLGRNLTDEEVLQFGGDTPLSALISGAKSNYAFYAQGRTLSVQGTLRF